MDTISFPKDPCPVFYYTGELAIFQFDLSREKINRYIFLSVHFFHCFDVTTAVRKSS
jgi:hypothetical protein